MKSRTRAILTALVTLLLPVLALVPSSDARVAGISKGTRLLQKNVRTAVKIAPEVLADTADGKSASVVILLADQADVSAAYDMKDQDARGWFVYNTLTQHAAAHPGGTPGFLDVPGRQLPVILGGQHAVATADRTLVESLAARADVARIDSNRPARWIEDPDRRQSAAPAPDAPEAVEWGVQNVNAPAVWALGFTGQGIVIGDQDTGIRWTHDALKTQYRGWNGVSRRPQLQLARRDPHRRRLLRGELAGALRRQRPRHPHGRHDFRRRRRRQPDRRGSRREVDRLPQHGPGQRHAGHLHRVLPVHDRAHGPEPARTRIRRCAPTSSTTGGPARRARAARPAPSWRRS